MRFKKLLVMTFAATAAVACGDDDGDGTPMPDAATGPDAMSGGPDAAVADAAPIILPDAAPVTCEVAPDFAALGAIEGFAIPSQFGNAFYVSQIDASDANDYLWVELYDGVGVFTEGLAAGTYTIAGDETNYETCGLCVLIYANWVDTNGDPEQFYFATAGSVTIENTTTGMKGSFSNLVFQHVTIDPDTFTSTVASSCASQIASASYDEFYPEADCTNGMDDDQDTFIDCADDDCDGDLECMVPDAGVPDAAGPDGGVPDAAVPDAMAS